MLQSSFQRSLLDSKTTLASLISATIKAFLLGSVVITMTAMSAQADPLDKSSPKIAHGRYRYLAS